MPTTPFLPVNNHQLILLRAASGLNWRNVEPAIFGTLLERALNPHDRHKLGAHYTPRAYVERLVLPTVIEPLRAEWESVRTAALTHARLGKVDKAIQEIRAWHQHLCQVKVLDPACGSGNFLYVTLEHMKRLEGEVLVELEKYGDRELTFEMQHFSVDPHQFLGIEVNPRAASITELVLWIGYLQWHFRTRGQTMPAEPIIKKFKNIECRDAVLAWDGEPEPQRDESGNIITVWDRRSYKKDLVTGREIPDESKRIPLLTYKNPRPAEWPQADYIVGNPPFLGPGMMRAALGDGYAQTLRDAYPEVSESTDFVMYWWNKAARTVRNEKAKRFGLITTNSIRQTFARRVLDAHLQAPSPLSIVFAIPDHPWVDSGEGADVRIGMTVGVSGTSLGEVWRVLSETAQDDGSAVVTFATTKGRIASDLTTGALVSETVPLKANDGVCSPGVKLHGSGFIVSPDLANELGLGGIPQLSHHIRQYRNGRDLNDSPRGVYVIDLFGLSADEVRLKFPRVYQHVLTSVKPERDAKADTKDGAGYAKHWWVFGKPRQELRRALRGLRRFIATTETSKHRFFQFLDISILPDNMLIGIALEDPFFLGVLSSRIHVCYALAAGGRLGVGNDPRYNKSRCFDPFPFPDCTEPPRDRIRKIAEELDAHRKHVQANHPDLTLTGMYNVLEKLRANQPLTDKEKAIHEKGLVSVLKQLHDDLDAAVFDAYGWPRNLIDAEILERLVALNAERAREEAAGHIRWLRPDYQIPLFHKATGGARSTVPQTSSTTTSPTDAKTPVKSRNSKPAKPPWPKSLPDRTKAVLAEVEKRGAAPFTADDIARTFKRAQTPQVIEILETLCAVGKAKKQRNGTSYTA